MRHQETPKFVIRGNQPFQSCLIVPLIRHNSHKETPTQSLSSGIFDISEEDFINQNINTETSQEDNLQYEWFVLGSDPIGVIQLFEFNTGRSVASLSPPFLSSSFDFSVNNFEFISIFRSPRQLWNGNATKLCDQYPVTVFGCIRRSGSVSLFQIGLNMSNPSEILIEEFGLFCSSFQAAEVLFNDDLKCPANWSELSFPMSMGLGYHGFTKSNILPSYLENSKINSYFGSDSLKTFHVFPTSSENFDITLLLNLILSTQMLSPMFQVKDVLNTLMSQKSSFSKLTNLLNSQNGPNSFSNDTTYLVIVSSPQYCGTEKNNNSLYNYSTVRWILPVDKSKHGMIMQITLISNNDISPSVFGSEQFPVGAVAAFEDGSLIFWALSEEKLISSSFQSQFNDLESILYSTISTAKLVGSFKEHTGPILSLAMMRQEFLIDEQYPKNYFVSCGGDNKIVYFSVTWKNDSNGKLFSISMSIEKLSINLTPQEGSQNVSIRHDGLVAVGGFDGLVRLYEILPEKLEFLGVLRCHDSTINKISFTPNNFGQNSLIATASNDNKIALWEIF